MSDTPEVPLPRAFVELRRRQPADVARLFLDQAKTAIDECDPEDRHELLQELFEYAVSNGGRHDAEYHLGYTVCLDQTVAGEDAWRTVAALMSIRHVLSVEPIAVEPGDAPASLIRRQERHRLHGILTEALQNG